MDVSRIGKDDPIAGFNFSVTFVDLGLRMGFTRVAGLDAQMKPYEYTECSELLVSRKLPDVMRFGNVTFERGVGEYAGTLYALLSKMVQYNRRASSIGADLMRVGAIGVYVQRGTRQGNARFVLLAKVHDAIPISFEFGPLVAGESKLLVQRLIVANEGIDFFPAPSSSYARVG